MFRPLAYQQRVGVAFAVPASKGVYPTFAAGATKDQKNIAIADFIVAEKDILRAEACQ